MNDYKLFKEMKDRGFPQKSIEIEGEIVYLDMNPALEEVIEACGEGRILIARNYEISKSGLDMDWHWDVQKGVHQCSGKTPLEAVCRLFLALNPVTIESNDISKDKDTA